MYSKSDLERSAPQVLNEVLSGLLADPEKHPIWPKSAPNSQLPFINAKEVTQRDGKQSPAMYQIQQGSSVRFTAFEIQRGGYVIYELGGPQASATRTQFPIT
ncbi:hypothetical protein N7510_006948 [Penicillium lagena]|uniref:uncharacterized protein n=1 Tax=Penicillium lagena TaxID=94218 RepID=UPI0025400DC4|nr:uncharacterized protein N7510_006948 [Penicillium lagena]KAJ5610229.1 hypothetical protein N7510_006948 [Penicillium lagena]